jgi:hypothetical protein
VYIEKALFDLHSATFFYFQIAIRRNVDFQTADINM